MKRDHPFRIAVTGDTGWDVYTEYVKGYVSDDRRVSKPEAAYDMYVAAGAAYTTLALRTLLPIPDFESQHFLPAEGLKDPWDGKVFSTLIKLLVELSQFTDKRLGSRRLRISRVRPLHDEDSVAGAGVFHNLIGAPLQHGQEPEAPNPRSIDLLV
ncbi:MAG TPA: hypothetical protein VJ739_07745, partial [Gemmataceae bacterium]|nr:hypothetical protein [Gemmataceae bacterium]